MTAPLPRWDHVGSLLRPPALLEARRRLQGDWSVSYSGPLWTEELAPLEDQCIRIAVTMQEELGYRLVTDGEFRRRTWWQNFVAAIEGTTIQTLQHAARFSDGKVQHEMPTPVVHGRLRRQQGIATREFAFLKSVAAATPKITIPSPPILHFFGGRAAISAEAYPDLDGFWDDVVAIYRAELDDLGGMGCTYVQLDEINLVCLCDPRIRESFRARGEDPDEVIRRYVSVINRSIAGRPTQMRIGLHLCRGNSSGRWLAEGGYDYVADLLFNELDVDAYLLEYDSPRAGDFSPLRLVPPRKRVMLGLVTTKSPRLEESDDLKRRIDEAARHLGHEQLGLCPQCGFGSNFLGGPLSQDDQRRKLSLVVETARDVWGST